MKIMLGKKLRKRGGVVLRAPICSSKNTRNDNIRISFQNSFAKSIFLPTEAWRLTHLFFGLVTFLRKHGAFPKKGKQCLCCSCLVFSLHEFLLEILEAKHPTSVFFLVFTASWCMKAFGRFNLVPNSQNNFCFKVNFFKLSASVFTSK